MRSILLGLVFAAAILFANVTRASEEIPFEFRDGLIWVKVQTPARTLNFVLDSGAGASVVDLRAALSLQLKMGSSISVQGVDSREGARYVDGFPGKLAEMPLGEDVLALNLDDPSRLCSRRIDGLVGIEWFKGRIVEIDFKKKVLRLLDKPAPAAITLPLVGMNGAFCVPVSVNGARPCWVRLDTGCNTPLQFVVNRRTANAWLHSSVGFALTAGRITRGEVQLGATRLDGVEIALHDREIFPGESGLLGTGILSKFRVIIDLKADLLSLNAD